MANVGPARPALAVVVEPTRDICTLDGIDAQVADGGQDCAIEVAGDRRPGGRLPLGRAPLHVFRREPDVSRPGGRGTGTGQSPPCSRAKKARAAVCACPAMRIPARPSVAQRDFSRTGGQQKVQSRPRALANGRRARVAQYIRTRSTAHLNVGRADISTGHLAIVRTSTSCSSILRMPTLPTGMRSASRRGGLLPVSRLVVARARARGHRDWHWGPEAGLQRGRY